MKDELSQLLLGITAGWYGGLVLQTGTTWTCCAVLCYQCCYCIKGSVGALQGHQQCLQWVKHSAEELGQAVGLCEPAQGTGTTLCSRALPLKGAQSRMLTLGGHKAPGFPVALTDTKCLSNTNWQFVKHKGLENISPFKGQKVKDKKLKQIHRHQRKNMFCSMSEQPKIN